MPTKVLIVDPDISFALPVKRGLEQSGEFVVNVFTTGRAAVEAVQREAQDVVVLDFSIEDIELPALIPALRQEQPDLFVLVSPRTADEIAQVQSLDAQGSIAKPYLARQLGPVIREAIAARTRLVKAQPDRLLDLDKLKTGSEPEAKPDDTFYRIVAAMYSGPPGKTKTGEMAAVQSEEQPAQPPDQPVFVEPEIPHDATIRELVSGQASTPPAVEPQVPPTEPVEPPLVPPDTVPELVVRPGVDLDKTPMVASLALSVAQDDTIPLESLTPPAFIARVEQELGIEWVPQTPENADEPTLIGPIGAPKNMQPRVYQPGDSEPTQPMGGIVQERLERDRTARPDLPVEVEPTPAAIQPMQAEQTVQLPPNASSVETAKQESPRSVDSAAIPAANGEPQPSSPSPVAPQAEPAQAGEPVTNMALQLTQLMITSAAQAALITRGINLIASAGRLDVQALTGIVAIIGTAWQDVSQQSGSLVRFINVPGAGDFLLYSTLTTGGMVLSMLFPADTPLREIRRQAKSLIAALQNVPESPVESQAAITLPSRPTDLRPPEGLLGSQAAVEAVAGASPAQPEELVQPESAPAAPVAEGPYVGYSFVWLPRIDTLSSDMAGVLLDWINSIGAAHSWQLQGVEVQPSYVTVQVSIPANDTPTAAVEALMLETASRAEDTALWADAYYIVTPSRAVTQQEIANFMDYRRSALDAA